MEAGHHSAADVDGGLHHDLEEGYIYARIPTTSASK
jgi:hypothetical protein